MWFWFRLGWFGVSGPKQFWDIQIVLEHLKFHQSWCTGGGVSSGYKLSHLLFITHILAGVGIHKF